MADAVAQIARYRQGPTFVRGDLSSLPAVNAALRVDQPEQALDALAAHLERHVDVAALLRIAGRA